MSTTTITNGNEEISRCSRIFYMRVYIIINEEEEVVDDDES